MAPTPPALQLFPLLTIASWLRLISAAECFLGGDVVHVNVVPTRTPTSITTKTALRYIQYGGIDDENNNISNNNNHPNNQGRRIPRRLVIPLVGPIPNAPPLLVGGEMLLSPPTPGQWQSLQEAVAIHRNALAAEDQQSSEGGTIDAAPLVAVIDGVTAGPTATVGRYATLAAVVGISSKDWSDADSQEAFWDSIMAPSSCGDIIRPFSSTVRLVGVGRARLSNFFHRTPTSLLDGSGGDDVSASDEEIASSLDQERSWDEEDDSEGYDPPIIMAQFTPLVDGSADSRADAKTLGNKESRSVYRSPVHALSELNSMLHRVSWMHDDRRRLVNGITAAKARLDARRSKDNGDTGVEYNDFDDLGWVGLPRSDATASGSEMKAKDEISMGDFLSSFQNSRTSSDPLAELAQAEERQKAVNFLEGRENLGLSYFGYFSSIQKLTEQALKLFVPYYSEDHRSREEHEFEIASFVALRTVEGYASPTEVGWALQSTSTIERLQATYDIMATHRVQLEKMAELLSQQLMDCGEECTDLW